MDENTRPDPRYSVSSAGSVPGDGRSARTRALKLKPPFRYVEGYCWRADLFESLIRECDDAENPLRSPWRLIENGRQIGIPHASHASICSTGTGFYSHWHHVLYFSSSDNSDPNLNNREYELECYSDGYVDWPRIIKTTRLEWIPSSVIPPEVDSAASRLAPILEERGVKEVTYFHTDHFEPWGGTSDQQQRALSRFADLTRQSTFGRRLSLFLTPPIWFSLVDPQRPTGYRTSDGDNVALWERGHELEGRCRDSLRLLEAEIGHEFHIHIHHENWTRTDRPNVNYDVADWVNDNSDPDKDLQRLDLFLQMSRHAMSQDLGRDMSQWAFIHGHWALNASDSRYCQIEREIELLHRHGCYGDFTFPAPNQFSQPKLITCPYTCKPTTGPKSYDSPVSDARPIACGSHTMGTDRFLIWNSPIEAHHVSLDFYSADNLGRYQDPETVVRIWLERNVVLGARLYIKTHAHSLHTNYKLWEDGRAIPHSHPDIVVLFELLQRVCDKAGIPFVCATVSEVMRQLRAFDNGDDGVNQEDAIHIKPRLPEVSKRSGRVTATPVISCEEQVGSDSEWRQMTADALDQEIYSFLKDEEDEKGPDAVYQWYRYKFLPAKIGLSPYDRNIAKFVVTNRDFFDKFVEIGAAAAQQSILVAMHRVQCTPVESSFANFDLMARLINRVQHHLDPNICNYIKPFCDWYPTRAAEYVTRRTLLCFPTLSWGLSDEQEEAILQSLPHVAGVVIGLRDFFRTRTAEDEQQRLISRIRSLGFEDPVEIYSWTTPLYEFPPDRIVYFARTGGCATGIRLNYG